MAWVGSEILPHEADVRAWLMGLVVLHGFKGGPAEWSGGPVYDPETGEGAKIGYLTLRADGRLEVKGCKAIFCRSKIWKRSR